MIRRHLEYVPPKAGQLNPEVSPFLEEVIACLLEKDPARRFAGAGELARVIEEGERSPWFGERQELRRTASARERSRRFPGSMETPFIGRGKELDRLRSLFRQARQGDGRVAYIEGEAGAGKTRLVAELQRILMDQDEDACILYGSYPPGNRSASHRALREAMVGHFGESGVRHGLQRLLADTPRLLESFGAYLLEPGVRGEADALSPEALQTTYCRIARRLSEERPLVWIVEDLHFASADERDLVFSLARSAHGCRLMLVLTARPGLPPDELYRLEHLEACHFIRLGRLSREEVGDLLRGMLRSESLAGLLCPLVYAKSDGNPCFIAELVGELKAQRRIRQAADGSFSAVTDIRDLEIPSSLRNLALARVLSLEDDERSLLDAAAVQGFAFDPDLIAPSLGLERLEVLQGLSRVERRTGVIRPLGARFQFDHHLLQEVLYESLAPALRAEYHRRLAEVFESREGLAGRSPGDVTGEQAVFVALHFLKGGSNEKGRAPALLALRFLNGSFRNEEAADLADLALGAPGDGDPALRCDVRLIHAECLHRLGRRSEERAALEDALAAARSAGSRPREARALTAAGHLHYHVSEFEAARQVLTDALEAARAAGDFEVELQALGALGSVHKALGQGDTAREMFARQLALAAAAGAPREEASALGSLGGIFISLGLYDDARGRFAEMLALSRRLSFLEGEASASRGLGTVAFDQHQLEEALRLFEDARRIYHQMGDRSGEAWSLGRIANVHNHLGGFDRARESYEHCLGVLRELGDRRAEAVFTYNLGVLYNRLRQYAKGRDCFEKQLAICRDIQHREGEAWATCELGVSLLKLGRIEEGRERFESARTLFQELALPRGEAQAASLLGKAHLSLARYQDARRELDSSQALFTRIGHPVGAAFVRLYMAQLDLETGEPDRALDLLASARDATRGQADKEIEGPVTHLAAEIARCRGELPEAGERYEEAAAEYRRQGDREGLASALLALGRLRLEQGRTEDARPLFLEAASLAAELFPDSPQSLLDAYLALIGERDADAVRVGNDVSVAGRAEAHLVLHNAGASGDHLGKARALVDKMAEQVPEETRASFWRYNPVARTLFDLDKGQR